MELARVWGLKDLIVTFETVNYPVIQLGPFHLSYNIEQDLVEVFERMFLIGMIYLQSELSMTKIYWTEVCFIGGILTPMQPL
jgi:hypothetical protein